jgi:hypothetical protein
MIEREADQSRGERESPRAMTPEVVAARIVLPSCGCSWRGLVCLPVGCGLLTPRGRAASLGGAAQLLAAGLPLRSYIQFASKADVDSRHC